MFKDKVSNVIPEGAFYLWLDVEDGQSFSKNILEKEGLIVLPGSYLSAEVNGFNPGEKYVRIALVYDFETTEEAVKTYSCLIQMIEKSLVKLVFGLSVVLWNTYQLLQL